MVTSTAGLPRAEMGRMSTRPRSTLVLWVVGLSVWTALALLSAADTVIFLWANQQPVRWSYLLPSRLIDWYTCAIFTPAYFWMVRRWPLTRDHALRVALIYAGITIVFVVLKYSLHVPLINALYNDPDDALVLRQVLAGSFVRENIAFWCLLAVVLSVEYYRGLREREMQAARLETRLAEARLDALSAQLHPHFLFNTIQGISTLIHRDPEAADAMLAGLSTLLRQTLQRDDGHEIPLSQELELLDLYLAIVRSRFGDRLTVTTNVAADLSDAMVPRFLLQPLVENALHHGIAQHAGAGRIDITAARAVETLALRVSDNGPGMQPGRRPFPKEGIGLANTRDRLAQLYGSAQTLELRSGEDGGFQVTVRIPWHLAPITV
jgi:signal transduction histidine kinase